MRKRANASAPASERKQPDNLCCVLSRRRLRSAGLLSSGKTALLPMLLRRSSEAWSKSPSQLALASSVSGRRHRLRTLVRDLGGAHLHHHDALDAAPSRTPMSVLRLPLTLRNGLSSLLPILLEDPEDPNDINARDRQRYECISHGKKSAPKYK